MEYWKSETLILTNYHTCQPAPIHRGFSHPHIQAKTLTGYFMTDYRSLITDYCFVPQKLYRYIFWLGYFTVLITSVIPIVGNLDKIRFGYGVFKIRLDHLLHVAAYILICMYYFIGLVKGLALFNSDSPRKFILLTLLLGTVTEIVQLWVPARAFNVMDWVANVSGILLGVVVIFGTKNRRKRGREKAGER